MLKTRVITALLMMAVLLPSLFWLPQAAWAWLVAAFIGVAGWEWGGLLGWAEARRRMLGLVVTLICVGLASLDPLAIGAGAAFAPGAPWVFALYGLSTAFWCLLMPFWLRHKWALTGVSGLLVGGLLLFPTWLAMVQLRAVSPLVLLAVFAIVWMADIAAYFAGRRFGRHKLAPSISPGKTREGAYGALLGVALYGLLLRQTAFPDLLPLPWWLLLLPALTAISIIGDLFESLLKRQAGIKDSSHVLPGHGGVLDRIDSLTSTLPVVAFVWLCFLSVAA